MMSLLSYVYTIRAGFVERIGLISLCYFFVICRLNSAMPSKEDGICGILQERQSEMHLPGSDMPYMSYELSIQSDLLYQTGL